MELWILGPIEARIADEPLSLSRGKQLTVLGLLLLRAGVIVSTEELVDELWGESSAFLGRAHARGLRLAAPAALQRARPVTCAPGNGLRARARRRRARRP